MIAPDITFRGYKDPYTVITSFNFSELSPDGSPLPVLQGDVSEDIIFRIYNNFDLNPGVATAYNVSVTTYDNGSHTASTLPVSQTWIHMATNGFGENSSLPGLYTQFIGTDTMIGGSVSYIPEISSDGQWASPYIRAGSDGNGVGFLEVKSYASVPNNTPAYNYQFVVTCEYEYVL
jgi:hypothetical protein